MSEFTVKTCASCKHFRGPENLYVAQMMNQKEEPTCEHPDAASRDMIYGKALCRVERVTNKGCGKQGKLWESRQTEKKG